MNLSFKRRALLQGLAGAAPYFVPISRHKVGINVPCQNIANEHFKLRVKCIVKLFSDLVNFELQFHGSLAMYLFTEHNEPSHVCGNTIGGGGANPVTRVLSDRTGDCGGRPLRKIDMKQIRHANICFSEMFKHKASASTFVRLVF